MFEGVCQQKEGGDSIGCGGQPEGADKSGFAGFVPECDAAATNTVATLLLLADTLKHSNQ